jgi:hypothetical protein
VCVCACVCACVCVRADEHTVESLKEAKSLAFRETTMIKSTKEAIFFILPV